MEARLAVEDAMEREPEPPVLVLLLLLPCEPALVSDPELRLEESVGSLPNEGKGYGKESRGPEPSDCVRSRNSTIGGMMEER